MVRRNIPDLDFAHSPGSFSDTAQSDNIALLYSIPALLAMTRSIMLCLSGDYFLYFV